MNKDSIIGIVCIGVAAYLFYASKSETPVPPEPQPRPVQPIPKTPRRPCPGPDCPFPTEEKATRSPFQTAGVPQLGTITHPDTGFPICCDLPQSEKSKNVGGRDGAGLCVFTSVQWSARWQNERKLWSFQDQMRGELGGGHPQKLDRMIAKYAPGARYLQHTRGDMGFLRTALKTGRMPAVTYGGYDPHYRSYVAHMVNLVHMDDKWAAVSDNNYPGDDELVWMSCKEFERRWRIGEGGGWAVILLSPAPPPRIRR